MQPTTVTLEGREFPIAILRHSRAKRYTLRYDSEAELIKLTVPKRASIKAGIEFTQSRANWLFQQMHKSANKTQLLPGAEFPLLGLNTLLTHQPGRGVATLFLPPASPTDSAMGRLASRSRSGLGRATHLSSCTHANNFYKTQILMVHGDERFFSNRLKRYLQQYLREYIEPIAMDYASELGVRATKITVRDTTSHWGSCTAEGKLSFAFRLVFAPTEVVNYLIAHEVAHLREMNHSAAFWRLVEQLCPEYKAHKAWLKQHGAELSNYISSSSSRG